MPMENETLIDRLMYMYSGEQDPDRQTDVHMYMYSQIPSKANITVSFVH